MESREMEPQDETGTSRRFRKVSRPLFIGILLLPPIFVWFLLKRGYSSRAQALGVAWLGVIGVLLLLSAPHGFWTKSAGPDSGNPLRSWELPSAGSDQAAGGAALEFELSQTRSMYRMLRTSVTLKNNVGRDLNYVEVFCSYYDGRGALLGYGMSNWTTVNIGDTVTGEVVASGVEIDDVQRRECRARHL
jgi:hypothetical protein